MNFLKYLVLSCCFLVCPFISVAKTKEFSSKWTLIVDYTKSPNSETQMKNTQKSLEKNYANLTNEQIKKLPEKIQNDIAKYNVKKGSEAEQKTNASIVETKKEYKLGLDETKVYLSEIGVNCTSNVLADTLDWPQVTCVDQTSKLTIYMSADDCVDIEPTKNKKFDKITDTSFQKDIGKYQYSYLLMLACKNK